MTFQRSTYAAGGALQTREVWDSVALTYTVFNGAGAQVSTRPLTAPEQVEIAARVAAATVEANDTTIRTRLNTALTVNSAFLALGATPTATQVRDQVIAATKELTGLIKKTLNDLTDTAGT